MPLGRETVYRMDIRYAPETFQNVTITSSFSQADKNMDRDRRWSGWIESEAPGHIVYSSMPGHGKIKVAGEDVLIYLLPVLDRIYEMRFPEETS